jgi:hypothetical protein
MPVWIRIPSKAMFSGAASHRINGEVVAGVERKAMRNKGMTAMPGDP